MSKGDSVHPWQRGFRVGRCPNCHLSGGLWFTGERTQEGHHIYHCDLCGADVASPTFYAWCNFDNTVLEADTFYNPCIHGMCPHFRGLPNAPARCENFRPVKNQMELEGKKRREIEGSMRDFKPAGRQPEPDIGSIGVDLEAEKKKRLRRLRGEEAGV